MQNRDSSEILGANVPIIQVGISNFRIPLSFATASDKTERLEASVTGSVSLDRNKKGINMSRIMRVFYEYENEIFTPDLLETILKEYKERMDTRRARLKLNFSYPIRKESLRSGLSGYQYYECSYEGLLAEDGSFTKIIHFDFIYSSACPCSSELAEHARKTRNVYAIPHSQRSKARLSLKLAPNQSLSIETIQKWCQEALTTETQVMVKREDEQAFAELNGAQIKFVEDAARLIYEGLADRTEVVDFKVAIAHLESLHSHDAVAVITKGVPDGFDDSFEDFKSLIC